MKKGTREADRHIEVVLRAVDVLECFLEKPRLSLKEIIAGTGLNRSRAIRLIGTLAARGYLQYLPDDRQYTLSSRLFALGKVYEHNNIIISLSQPILQRLTEETGESSTLWILEGSDRMILCRSQGELAVSFPMITGTRQDLHAGSAGKLILAYLPDEVRERVLLERPLVAYTKNTIVDRENLKKELAKISAQGFAVSCGEVTAGFWAVSAPVLDHKKEIRGAVSLAGPVARFTDEKKSLCQRLVIEAAAELSDRMGHPAME